MEQRSSQSPFQSQNQVHTSPNATTSILKTVHERDCIRVMYKALWSFPGQNSTNSHCQSLQTLNLKLPIWCSGRACNFPNCWAHHFSYKLGIGLAVDAQFPSTCCLWDEAEVFMTIPFSALCWCCTKSRQKNVLSA